MGGWFRDFGLRKEETIGGGGDEAQCAAARRDMAGESSETADEGMKEDSSFEERADVRVEVWEGSREDDILGADEVDCSGDDHCRGVDGSCEPGLDALGGDVVLEHLPGWRSAGCSLAEGSEESLAGDEGFEAADGTAHTGPAVAVNAGVSEFAGERE